MADLSGASWRKSTYSSANNDCVELARTAGAAGIRDSKNSSGPSLGLAVATLTDFLDAVKDGRFSG